VRELENITQRLVVISQDPLSATHDLPFKEKSAALSNEHELAENMSLKESGETLER